MELALSLGNTTTTNFCMANKSTAEIKPSTSSDNDHHMIINNDHDPTVEKQRGSSTATTSSSDRTPSDSPRQLELLPFSPALHTRPSNTTTTTTTTSQQPHPLSVCFPWLSNNLSPEPGSSNGPGSKPMEVSCLRPAVETMTEDGEEHSSPNSETSSFMEFSLYKRRESNGGENQESGGNYVQGVIATTSRGSDDDENGCTRKKLRLSKEQSAFLEESFKEHHTLNPKQKLALAKELSLRPRQVEVWFQNRRARTKLKQTEVDCEYLKKCCETLTEENKRLQKELHDLRALKSSQPFYMQLPATTLTMCPSCERVGPASTSSAPTSSSQAVTITGGKSVVSITSRDTDGITLSLGEPSSVLPFSNAITSQAQKDSSS